MIEFNIEHNNTTASPSVNRTMDNRFWGIGGGGGCEREMFGVLEQH